MAERNMNSLAPSSCVVFEVARIYHVSLLKSYVFVGMGSSTYSITFNFMAVRQKQTVDADSLVTKIIYNFYLI